MREVRPSEDPLADAAVALGAAEMAMQDAINMHSGSMHRAVRDRLQEALDRLRIDREVVDLALRQRANYDREASS